MTKARPSAAPQRMPFVLLRCMLLALILALSGWFFMGYSRKATLFYGDDLGYYVYLPSAFIYHNLDSINKIPVPNEELPYSVNWYYGQMANPAQTTPTGHVLIQYTYGVALLESPFFLAAHAWVKLTGGHANGYSPPYIILIKLSTVVYALLGLLIVYRILRRHFNKTLSVAGITGIFIGTNLFWFTLHQAGMAHVPLFFLYALLMYLSLRVYERPRMAIFLAIGLNAGIITLIRPTDVICLLIPLLYGVWGKNAVSTRLQFLRQHYVKIAAMIPAFLLPVIPQMLYWKWLAGSYLYYSYGSQQQFYWDHPKIIAGFLSMRMAGCRIRRSWFSLF